MIYESASALIGATPLVALDRIAGRDKLRSRVLAKLEWFNPGGSVKDRAALSMIGDAEAKGLLTRGCTIIEPTSGNTGIGLCAAAAARGYRCVIVMPDSMSAERRRLMSAYGAEIVLTPGALGMSGAVAKAEELAKAIPDCFMPCQFTNPANPAAHYRATGPEIWTDTQGRVDIFVAGIGTGGTVSGVGRFLKERNSAIRIVGVEPRESPLLSENRSGRHGIQGIGANFVPDTLDRSVLDEIFPVSTEQAYRAAQRLGREEGLLCGISAGAALHAALTLAARSDNAGKTIVALLPDSGERYLSTDLY